MKKPQEPALGRGLDALLGNTTSYSPDSGVNSVALDLIQPNPFQPRQEFDPESLSELAESIKNIGIVQPVTLKQVSADKYFIISGERRVRASRLAGLRTIPAYIRKVDDVGMLEMAIVENIQRENLNPIDTALSFQRLIDECNLTQEEMADRVGKKRSSIANYIRLLSLPPEIQKAVRNGQISMGHAKALLSVSDSAAQDSLCERIIREGLSVRAAEDLAASSGHTSGSSSKANVPRSEERLPESYLKLVQVLGRCIDSENISAKRSKSGAGFVKIRFSGDDELATFLKALEQSSK
jgi:ParB family chromosome partitioning protein